MDALVDDAAATGTEALLDLPPAADNFARLEFDQVVSHRYNERCNAIEVIK